MKKTFLFLSFLLSMVATAQVTFMKGNFVNSQNVKVECLIKNYDWNNYPSEIEYKLNDSDVVEKIYTAQLQSFYIYETSHFYKKYDVPAIPQQPGDFILKSGLQLLKVLVEGKISLLKNNDDVYLLETEGILVPLLHYKYISRSTNIAEENNSYRLELFNRLKCEGIEPESIRKVSYTQKSLTKLVNNYNACAEGTSKDFTENKTKAELNFKIIAGMNFYTPEVDAILFADRTETQPEIDDAVSKKGQSKSNFAVGFEAEVKLPFNHKKWALFIAPTYNKQEAFSVNASKSFGGYPSQYYLNWGYKGIIDVSEYSYIEVPIGIRRYFYLGKNSLLNLNLAYGVSLGVGDNANAEYIRNENTRNVRYDDNVTGFSLLRLGAGYTYKRYNLGVNYYVVKFLGASKANGSVSVMLGYKIL
ncbi:hypothetical protein GR160_15535 [Flavobacterium sp. Sd200]|uniref:hypothetical protein n=1 Tax=Flavobacterium sp. Sd200 TaxID=2692211 RepID=UPI001370FAFB|nr:hypothetical protein [Flavobacterium sp. Sd200]MXN92640.1 hypothetical protein [Flavobacterium sp. Sd200]